MIIVSEDGPLEIGRTYRDKWLTDEHCVQHGNVPYTVLRVASEAEWKRQCRAAGARPINVTGSKLFYEISTDYMKPSQRLIEERKYVEATLGDFSSICGDCKASLATFADRCTADLDVPCPGYLAIERAKRAFAGARAREDKP